MVFFEDMNSFLQRIVILETKLPKYNAYQNCLMDVLTSFLAMCGFAHRYIELGRFSNMSMSVVRDTPESIRDDMSKLLRAFDDQKREQSKQRGSGEQKGKPSAAEHGKHPSAKGIRNILMEVEGEDREYHVLQETIVPDTSAAYRPRKQNESLSSFANGVISAINHVAEQSPELCEALYTEIVRDESQINQGSSDDLLRKLLGVAPGKDSNGRLFLESSSKPPLNIEIAREKQMMDLRTIIWARINSLSALKKFSRYVQQRVADKTEEIAPIKIRSSGPRPSFFDIVNTLEREGAVLRSLEKPLPLTLYQRYEGTAVDELEKVQKTSQSDDLYQDGKLAIKFRERSMRGFFREEPVAPNDCHRPRRSEAHRQMFLTCCNFIQPEHPRIMGTDKGVREYAVNYVPHHWRHIEAEHLRSSFARIQEEELKIAFYNDENFDDSFFDRFFSWAGLLPDVEVALSTEATEWWTLVAERLRDCLLQHAKLHVRRLQDAVDVNTAKASFSAANGALRISLYRQVQPAESNPQAAYEDIQACLRQTHDESVPLPLRRSVYNTKGQIETKLGRRQDAAASYELARSVDPSNLVTGDALRAQIKLFEKEPGKQEFIRTLKTWSPLERLAYLCWDTWDSFYQAVIRAAVESREVAFVVQMYQNSIRLLENVNASAPLIVELGFLHINATRDLEAARTVFDQALDSGSPG
ncbi:hypothetical protein CGCVW01_v014359 [Colletotrichum viniferum]|nr:hypothetical protein CGCVW01_v014359 [Colletotrichum viniferum]